MHNVFMPYFKDRSNQKNSIKISHLSLSDLPLDFYHLLDRQHAFLVFFNPVVNAWPSQMWMNKLLGVSACYRLCFTCKLHLGPSPTPISPESWCL